MDWKSWFQPRTFSWITVRKILVYGFKNWYFSVTGQRTDAKRCWRELAGFSYCKREKLTIAPEIPAQTMKITSLNSDIQLLDGRFYHNNGWFVVRSEVPSGATTNAIEWVVEPNVVDDFKQKPVVHVSQVGYHPNQPKIATVELDNSETKLGSFIASHFRKWRF